MTVVNMARIQLMVFALLACSAYAQREAAPLPAPLGRLLVGLAGAALVVAVSMQHVFRAQIKLQLDCMINGKQTYLGGVVEACTAFQQLPDCCWAGCCCLVL